MIELPLIFVSGLLASSHCVGMCGGFVIALGVGSPTVRQNLARQSIFSLGRCCTYTAAGAVAGYLGHRLETLSNWYVDAQAALALVAGVLLVHEGLRALGVPSLVHRLWPSAVPRAAGCAAVSGFRSLLGAPDLASAFAAGVLTGFMPCGLVYAYLAVAGSGASIPRGAAVMAAFGLGTIPLLVTLGLGFQRLNVSFRRAAFRVAGAAVVSVGIVSLARGGLALVSRPASGTPAECPLCASTER